MTEQEQIELLKKQLKSQEEKMESLQCELFGVIVELCEYCQNSDVGEKLCLDCNECDLHKLSDELYPIAICRHLKSRKRSDGK
jgi:hypothetical protein